MGDVKYLIFFFQLNHAQHIQSFRLAGKGFTTPNSNKKKRGPDTSKRGRGEAEDRKKEEELSKEVRRKKGRGEERRMPSEIMHPNSGSGTFLCRKEKKL